MKRVLILLCVAATAGCTSPTLEVMEAKTLAALEGAEVEIEERPIEDARRKALESYQKLLTLNPGSSARPEVIRRIADLKVELGESVPLPDESDPIQIETYRRTVDQHYSEAAEFYQRLLEEFPESETAPSVYYQLAKAYEQQGNDEDILVTLNDLADKYPDLEGLDEVHFRRAELMFSRDDLSGAKRAYQRVIEFGQESAYYERSLYKRGWTLFKQNRFDAGIDEFVTLFDLSLPRRDEGYFELLEKSRTDREFLADALRAVSLSMSYLEGPQSIPEYFEGDRGRPYEDLIYGSLAAHYLEKERFADSALAELEFVAQHPSSRQAPLFQHRAIMAYASADFPERVLEEKRNYVTLYEERYDDWQFRDPELREEVRGHLEVYLDELAKHSHSLAQQEKQPAERDKLLFAAITYYEKYLHHFGDDSNSAPVHFLMSEALFESRRYREATIEYEQVAYKYPKHAQSSEAGYAALVSYDKHQEHLPPVPSREQILDAQARGETAVTESESVRWKRAGIQSARFFFDQFPDHEHAPAVLTRAANDLYALGDHKATVEAATLLVNVRPPVDAKLRFSAWTVLAHSEFEQAHFDRAELAYKQSLSFLKPEDERRGNFIELLAASIYRQGELSREAQDYDAAVNHFLRLGKEVPESPIRIVAEYDAASVLLETEQWTQAISVLTNFRSSYPEHELQAEVTRNLAVAYLNSGSKLDAAREFSRLGSESDNPTFRREASLQAAELYEEAGARKQAIAAYADYVVRYPDPFQDNVELHQKLVELNTEDGNSAGANQWRQKLVNVEATGGAQRSDRTRYLAATATLVLAEPMMASYQRIQLTIPLNESLARKKSGMERALKIYAQAAGYGVQEVSTAATHHTGDIYQSLSSALLDSERPPGLSELELEQYEILLEDEAFPFEEKAIEVYEINTARMPQGVYDEWVERSLAALAQLIPGRYDKPERLDPYVEALE